MMPNGGVDDLILVSGFCQDLPINGFCVALSVLNKKLGRHLCQCGSHLLMAFATLAEQCGDEDTKIWPVLIQICVPLVSSGF